MDENMAQTIDDKSSDETNNNISSYNGRRLGCTSFEDMSNELIYEIFDYLTAGHAFEGFSGLNTRFEHLLTRSSLPLKVDFLHISKPEFHYRCKQIITPYMHRIISFRFPNQMSMNLFNTLFSFKSFNRLQSVILNKMIIKNILSILVDLASLPQLYSLTIVTIDHSNADKRMCQLIFHLPVLKYCKISFDDSRKDFPLPITDEKLLQNSSIEYLIINGFYNIDGLIPILSNMPKLRHLSCNSLWGSDSNTIQQIQRISSSLQYLSLKLDDVSFKKFKSIICRYNFSLEVLRITALFDKKYLHADRWQHLILNHMPQLRVFDYECHCNTIDDNDQSKIYHNLIEKFNSSFWLERKWFFGHRHGHFYNKTYAYVYSIKPYRKKHYFYVTPEKNERCTYRDTGLNLAQCVTIHTEAIDTKSSVEFSRIMELDLVIDSIKYDPTIISKLSAIIPLTQLVHLCFDHSPFPVGLMLDILDRAINVHTLVLHNTKMLDIKTLTFEQTQILHSLFAKNQIRKISLDVPCKLRHYKFLINLCPRLKYLKMKLSEKYESILRYLLNQSRNKKSQLCLLCISNIDKIFFKQTQTMIDRERLLNDYLIELIGNELYIWW